MVAALVHAVDGTAPRLLRRSKLWQFTVQEAIKIFLLTFVSPQFAAKMFPPKGGRVAFSRTALHQVPNAILGVLRNVIA